MLMCPKILGGIPNESPTSRASNQDMNRLSILLRTRVINILVNQNKGKLKENFKFKNPGSLQLMDTGRYNFIFLTSQGDPKSLNSFNRIRNGHDNFATELC
jgi:hypothetical protein